MWNHLQCNKDKEVGTVTSLLIRKLTDGYVIQEAVARHRWFSDSVIQLRISIFLIAGFHGTIYAEEMDAMKNQSHSSQDLRIN